MVPFEATFVKRTSLKVSNLLVKTAPVLLLCSWICGGQMSLDNQLLLLATQRDKRTSHQIGHHMSLPNWVLCICTKLGTKVSILAIFLLLSRILPPGHFGFLAQSLNLKEVTIFFGTTEKVGT